MTLGPAKHEKVAIFRRKMSEFRMFSGFREHKVRRNPCIIGDKILFDPKSFDTSISQFDSLCIDYFEFLNEDYHQSWREEQ